MYNRKESNISTAPLARTSRNVEDNQRNRHNAAQLVSEETPLRRPAASRYS